MGTQNGTVNLVSYVLDKWSDKSLLCCGQQMMGVVPFLL